MVVPRCLQKAYPSWSVTGGRFPVVLSIATSFTDGGIIQHPSEERQILQPNQRSMLILMNLSTLVDAIELGHIFYDLCHVWPSFIGLRLRLRRIFLSKSCLFSSCFLFFLFCYGNAPDFYMIILHVSVVIHGSMAETKRPLIIHALFILNNRV